MSLRFTTLLATLSRFLSVDGRVVAFWSELGEFGDDHFEYDIVELDRL